MRWLWKRIISEGANEATGTKCTWSFEICWSWTRSQDPFAKESKMQYWRQAATWSAYLAMWCISYSQWMLQPLSHFNYHNYRVLQKVAHRGRCHRDVNDTMDGRSSQRTLSRLVFKNAAHRTCTAAPRTCVIWGAEYACKAPNDAFSGRCNEEMQVPPIF